MGSIGRYPFPMSIDASYEKNNNNIGNFKLEILGVFRLCSFFRVLVIE